MSEYSNDHGAAMHGILGFTMPSCQAAPPPARVRRASAIRN